MKQVLQHLGSGETTLVEAPAPLPGNGQLLIGTRCSLISAGTERMLVDFGRASIIEKAMQQPEKVRMVLEKVRTDGLVTTLDAVRSKLQQPLPLGYCNAGIVIEIGSGVSGFEAGDRVVSNGAHASVVSVPKNLCARIPDSVDDESAAFAVLAAIGLQGIRLARPALGETVAVTGLGLIGLMVVQMLRANGCRVPGIDFDPVRLELARRFGAVTVNLAAGEDAVATGMAFSNGKGVDAVVITASTQSSEPVSQAARMSRKRGRIVLVGVTGLELNRAEFYDKELTFQVSCSYGPGRYDPTYEEKGQDYPYGLVRWTEQRNFEAVLELMASGALDVKSLISHRVAFEQSAAAYNLLASDPAALGIVLQYPAHASQDLERRIRFDGSAAYDPARPVCGFIGAGNYASRVLIPAFKAAGAQLHTIVTSSGTSGVVHGRPAGFSEASTDLDAMLANPAINTAVIVTRHDKHATFASKALRAGKHVFLEKPLALTLDEVAEVESAWTDRVTQGEPRQLMVGFNRRFAPHVARMKALLASIKAPKAFIITVNAGAIPVDHWTQDRATGGGRIIGEVCHFIDLMRFLAQAPIVSLQAHRIGDAHDIVEDKAAITLGFANGSFGTVHYLANGSNAFPKERVEVFCGGRILQLDNFRKLRGYGWPSFRKMNLWRQDKGQKICAAAFLQAVATGQPAPIPFEEIIEVARVTIKAAGLLREQQ